MDLVALSRWQFAITCVYHFFFVPLTLGLSVLLAIMETIYVRTGQVIYKQMVQFWGKLFLINFGMGVVTGIVMEFQFGMNWSEYSRFVGDIFGAPLAIEALLAFFLESTFLGIWIFGWDKLSKKVHLLAIWLVAIGSNLSALWILIANSFMQQPLGYKLAEDGSKAILEDFGQIVFNPNVWLQFPHVVFSGFTTAAVFVLGISAYHLLRQKSVDFFRKSVQIASIFGVIAAFLVVLIGHSQAQHMVKTQPMKMAAAEALWRTSDPASFSLITIGNEPELRDVFSIRIPGVLSFLAYNRFSGEVKGILDLQSEYEKIYGEGKSYIPPIAVSYWTFRVMVGAGMLMLLLIGYLLYFTIKKKDLPVNRWTKLLPLMILLPYFANTAGWMLTELGRQPWVVFGLMRTEEAVSKVVQPGMVLASLIIFTLLYGVLMVADIYLLAKYAKAGPQALQKRVVAIEDEQYYE
jgi:cytochrome d ubiquinol oxidase subunit I